VIEDLNRDTRLYVFRASEDSLCLVLINSALRWGVCKMTLPSVGFGRAAVAIDSAECPASAADFVKAILDGEKLRDEFERRGHY